MEDANPSFLYMLIDSLFPLYRLDRNFMYNSHDSDPLMNEGRRNQNNITNNMDIPGNSRLSPLSPANASTSPFNINQHPRNPNSNHPHNNPRPINNTKDRSGSIIDPSQLDFSNFSFKNLSSLGDMTRQLADENAIGEVELVNGEGSLESSFE